VETVCDIMFPNTPSRNDPLTGAPAEASPEPLPTSFITFL